VVGEQAGSLHLCAGRSCAVHKVVVGRRASEDDGRAGGRFGPGT
jgi:hypothetical protein